MIRSDADKAKQRAGNHFVLGRDFDARRCKAADRSGLDEEAAEDRTE